MRIAIVVGEFHKEIADAMVRVAKEEATAMGVAVSQVVRVPGSYELPLAADRLLAKSEIDGVVALGYIEKGETLHGEIMGHVVHETLMQLQLKHGKPIGLGIIGPGATAEQAHVRKENAARAAVRAAAEVYKILKQL